MEPSAGAADAGDDDDGDDGEGPDDEGPDAEDEDDGDGDPGDDDAGPVDDPRDDGEPDDGEPGDGDPGDGDPGDGDPGDGDPGDDDPGDGGPGDGDPGDGGSGDPDDGDPGGGDQQPPPGDDIPDNAYCTPVSDWSDPWRELEEEVLVLVNEARAVGADCGAYGVFGPTSPLTMDGALRCAARNHSKNMAEEGFFAHDSPDGETPWDRIAASGYGGYSTAGENIAAVYPTPSAVVAGWLESDGHCRNMLNPAFQELGVGYYAGGPHGKYWTQNFATP